MMATKRLEQGKVEESEKRNFCLSALKLERTLFTP